MSLDPQEYKGKGGKDFGVVEAGTYPARVVQVIGLGEQEQFDWQTKESTGYKPRVAITFELPTETIEIDGEQRPRWYFKEYGLSDYKDAPVNKLTAALAPSKKVTNLAKLVGEACLITTAFTNSGKVKITGVSPLMKGMDVEPLQNPTKVFDPDEPDLEVYKSLPKWVRDKIKEGKKYKGSKLEMMVATDEADLDDDIPF